MREGKTSGEKAKKKKNNKKKKKKKKTKKKKRKNQKNKKGEPKTRTKKQKRKWKDPGSVRVTFAVSQVPEGGEEWRSGNKRLHVTPEGNGPDETAVQDSIHQLFLPKK